MADKPIIFSGSMVRAILAGRKTQTRRILRWQPDPVPDYHSGPFQNADGVWGQKIWEPDCGFWQFCPLRLPAAAGDRLWVRETWRTSRDCDSRQPSSMEVPGGGYGWPVWYEADGGAVTWRGSDDGGPAFTNPGKLRPSIFMPRWASRITLEVTEVRVERLQDISHDDAAAEGLIAERTPAAGILRNVAMDLCTSLVRTRWQGAPDLPLRGMERAACRDLWNSIHGKDAWDANPWVAAISFRRILPASHTPVSSDTPNAEGERAPSFGPLTSKEG
ncbi:hypothetical protein FHR71_005622 [Methylobacterium sp. RAS18]|nr:hypothetical protein [Methylobacterium sp. RAS18]